MRNKPAVGCPSRDTILRALTEVYRGPAWHGPSVRQAIRRLTPERALRKPGAARNSAWELLLHLVAARYIMTERVTGIRGGRFPRQRRASWWVVAPREPSAEQWREDIALLGEYQQRLVAAVAAAPASRLRAKRPGKKLTIAHELLGTALHDAYHAGQLILLARLTEP